MGITVSSRMIKGDVSVGGRLTLVFRYEARNWMKSAVRERVTECKGAICGIKSYLFIENNLSMFF